MRELSILENLSRIHRYSGIMLIKEESVSDHVWSMITLALEYIPKINTKFDLDIDMKSVVYKIAVHDLDESLYTDIPRPFKHHSKMIESAIEDTVNEIFTNKLGRGLMKELAEVEDRSKPESFLVKILDTAQAGYKMASELILGNHYFYSEIDNSIDSLYEMSEKLNSNIFDTNITKAFLWLIHEFTTELESTKIKGL